MVSFASTILAKVAFAGSCADGRVVRIARGKVLELASEKDKQTPDRKVPAKVHSKDRDMGSALRSAYQRTVDESVPDEMLDLLSKLA